MIKVNIDINKDEKGEVRVWGSALDISVELAALFENLLEVIPTLTLDALETAKAHMELKERRKKLDQNNPDNRM